MPYQGPTLPEPAHANLDSMLARKFGREVANYFSGSPLNRVSFLRADHKFLTSALLHPTTRFLLFQDLKPLTVGKDDLALRKYDDVRPLIGENPYFKPEEEHIEAFDSSKAPEPTMVFLGLDERQANEGLVWRDVYKGAPRFALDVTPRKGHEEEAKKLIKDSEDKGFTFLEGRQVLTLPYQEGAIYAQARMMIDWNNRNPFCGGCGQPTLSVNAGGKRACPPKDKGADRLPCPTRDTISNLSFPRTDPTIITAVVSHDNTRILLGRQKRWPPYFHSTLAGFCEPAESIEEAVRREVWEEAGVRLGRVVIHSSQPWPYPANLMIGCIGQTIPEAEDLTLENDPELEGAKWFTYDEVREALQHGISGLGEDPPETYKEGNLRLPPPTAIAYQLITSVVTGNFVSPEAKM